MKTAETQAIFAIAITVIASYLYFMILNRINSVKTVKNSLFKVKLYLFRKAAGFVLLGVIPALLGVIFFQINPLQMLRFPENSLNLWVWIIAVSVLLILLNLFNARSKELQAVYPELRLQVWNPGSLAIAGGGWMLYLTGYEFLFRGILLSGCIQAFEIGPAIVINLALYSSLHLPKGLKEAIAAIPFGALLCYLTIESNSVLPAILLHCVQAVSAEISCIYRNREMSFSIIKK